MAGVDKGGARCSKTSALGSVILGVIKVLFFILGFMVFLWLFRSCFFPFYYFFACVFLWDVLVFFM